MITRRVLLFAGAGAAYLTTPRGLAYGKGEFWNEKAPEQWSEKELQRLLTKSPWAKSVQASFNMNAMRGGGMSGGPSGGGMGGPPGGGPGGPGGGGMGGPPGGGGPGGPGGGMGGEMPQIKALVRWESALPIRAASKKPLQDAPASESVYIVSVSGMSMPGGQGQMGTGTARSDRAGDNANQLKEVTEIQRRGKDPLLPDRVEMSRDSDGLSTSFYFSGGAHPIRVEDKEVTFVTKLGPLEIRAKFPLKDMDYKGQLSL